MNRPSHWIIALFAIMGPALWVWGLTEGFGAGQEPVLAGPQRARLVSPPSNEASPVEALLTGRVVEQGGYPVDGALIRVIGGGRNAAFTRASGTFEVMVKLGDPYRRIEITANGFAPVVERCAPSDLSNFVVELAPFAPWDSQPNVASTAKRAALAGEGFVYDQDRKPLAGVVITALETGDGALTDEIGRFRIPFGAPRVSFVAWHPAGRAALIDSVAPTQTEGMVNLGVTTLREGVQLGGTVRLPGGAPAVATAVVLRHHGLVRRTLTDSSGAFQLAGLIAADYQLEVLPVVGALGLKRSLRIESSGVLPSELQMVSERPHRVRVVDAAHAPQAQAFVVASDVDGRRTWVQTDAEGKGSLRGLSAEGVRVDEVRSSAHATLKVVEVGAEAETMTIVAVP